MWYQAALSVDGPAHALWPNMALALCYSFLQMGINYAQKCMLPISYMIGPLVLV